MTISKKMRRRVGARDGGSCLRCGQVATNVQHRIGKGNGGTSRPEVEAIEALVSMCGSGTTGCHGFITEHPEVAYATGWAIRRSSLIPAHEIPVIDLWGREIYLHKDGTLEYTSPAGFLPSDPFAHIPPWSAA